MQHPAKVQGHDEWPTRFDSEAIRHIKVFMTSRTIDIHCDACGKYLFSIQPDDYEELHKDHYCKSKKCQQQAVVDKLKKEPVNK